VTFGRFTLSQVSAEEEIGRIERTVLELLRDIERLPADVLYREPRAGEWPVMSTLAHLEELLPYWAHEADGVARAPGKGFGRTHEDPKRLGAIEQHGHDSLDAIVPRIRAALDECVTTLRGIPEDGWSNVGTHPRRGPFTAAQIVKTFVVDHAKEHSVQIQATLSALGASTRS
jgi:uncharacterized damage-inducible protein DinB